MLPRLVIRQTFGMISIDSTPAQIVPRHRRMEMNLESTPASFEATTELPKVVIDQTESFASAGNKPVLRMADDFFSDALSKGIEAIEKIASESSAFLQIENNSNVIKEIARQSMDVSTGLTVTSMPSVPPKIDVTGDEFELNWTPSTLNINWEQVTVDEGSYVPGKIEVTWLQRPHIEITLDPGSELNIPVSTGVGGRLDEAT